MKKIIIFIFVIIFSKNLYSEQKNEVLFTIKNYPFTSIDLNQRKNYLELFYGTNNIFDKDSSFLNDLISVSLFNEFAIDKNIKINKDTLENYYNAIIKQYEDRNSSKFLIGSLFTEVITSLALRPLFHALLLRVICKIITPSTFPKYGLPLPISPTVTLIRQAQTPFHLAVI